jgi:Bardet-Biedl syndrome 4 protein
VCVCVCAGLVRRQQGRIVESLQLFQAALCLAPKSVPILKQVGRSLQLLGKHKHALDVFDQALSCGGEEDWEVHFAKGLSHLFRRDLDHAVEAFEESNSIYRHDETYMQLG